MTELEKSLFALFSIAAQMRALPHVESIRADLEAYELECEREGKPTPREALKNVQMIFASGEAFQKACLASAS